MSEVLLNIVLSVCVFAVVGSIAHAIVGGSGGLLHNAFVGFAGVALADIVCRVFGSSSIGIIWSIVLAIACSCVVILALNRIKERCGKNEDSEE